MFKEQMPYDQNEIKNRQKDWKKKNEKKKQQRARLDLNIMNNMYYRKKWTLDRQPWVDVLSVESSRVI